MVQFTKGDENGNGRRICHRIVMTGGPGAGKTTAADLYRRELGEAVVVVPEAASLLFTGGFPRSEDPKVVKATQETIYHVQKNLEDIQRARFRDRILICDRGTLDGVAYWPGDPDEFCERVQTTLEKEYARYDAVVFFETAAKGNLPIIEHGNPNRIESTQQAIALDKKLHEVWSKHPRFIYIPHDPSFFKKMTFALASIEGIVKQF